MKKRHAIFLIIICLLITAGCSKPASQPQGKVEITDDLGRTVTLDSPKRVAALIGSFADLWVDAGGKDTLCAAAHDTWTSFDLDLDGNVADLGDVKGINMEILLAAKPDLVIASAKNQSQLALEKTLEGMNIPVLYYDVSNFDDYLQVLKDFTTLTKDQNAYEEKGLKQKEKIEQLAKEAASQKPQKVLYLRAAGSSVKAKNSSGSVLGEMLKDLNTLNIADGKNDLLENLSMETILQENPDKIFLVYQGSDDTKAKENMKKAVLSNPLWQQLDAVKNNQVYVMDPKLYNLKPNDQWARAYEDLYNILYGNGQN